MYTFLVSLYFSDLEFFCLTFQICDTWLWQREMSQLTCDYYYSKLLKMLYTLYAFDYLYYSVNTVGGTLREGGEKEQPILTPKGSYSKRKWGDREGGSRSSPWDVSCPRKLFLDKRKSSETSAWRLTSVRCLKENIYSSAFLVLHHFLFSLRTWEWGKTACGRLGRQTSARTKTSARLKITFVDITYPGQRPEPPSLYPHFLLLTVNIYTFPKRVNMHSIQTKLPVKINNLSCFGNTVHFLH